MINYYQIDLWKKKSFLFFGLLSPNLAEVEYSTNINNSNQSLTLSGVKVTAMTFWIRLVQND